MLYTTLDTLKTYLGEDCQESNDELNELIVTATVMLDTELGQNIGFAEFTRRVNGTGARRITMERSDIVSVVSIRDIRTNTVYTLDYIDGATLYFTREIERGHKNIEIVYEAGFVAVPKDLERYFLEYCKSLWTVNKATDTTIVKSKKIGVDLAITYFSPSELASESLARPDMEAILRKYKNFQVMITA